MNHPYTQYEDSRLWRVVDQAVSDLVANKDLTEATTRQHIVGYLCKKLEEAGVSKRERGS